MLIEDPVIDIHVELRKIKYPGTSVEHPVSMQKSGDPASVLINGYR